MAEIDDNAHLKSGTGTHIFRLKGLQTKVFLDQNPNYAPYDTPPVSASYFMDISINSLLLDDLIFISAASNYIDNSRWPDISFSLGRINNSSKTDIDTYFVNHITKDIGPAWLAKNITGGYNNSDIFHNEDELVQQYITMDKSISNLNYLQISPTDLSDTKKLALNKISILDITTNTPVTLYSPDASGADFVTPGWVTGFDPSYALTTSDDEYLLYDTLDPSGVFINYAFYTQIGHAYKINIKAGYGNYTTMNTDVNVSIIDSNNNKPLYLHYDDLNEDNHILDNSYNFDIADSVLKSQVYYSEPYTVLNNLYDSSYASINYTENIIAEQTQAATGWTNNQFENPQEVELPIGFAKNNTNNTFIITNVSFKNNLNLGDGNQSILFEIGDTHNDALGLYVHDTGNFPATNTTLLVGPSTGANSGVPTSIDISDNTSPSTIIVSVPENSDSYVKIYQIINGTINETTTTTTRGDYFTESDMSRVFDYITVGGMIARTADRRWKGTIGNIYRYETYLPTVLELNNFLSVVDYSIDGSTNIVFYDNSIKSQLIKVLKRGGTSEANPVSGMNLGQYYAGKYNLGREIMLSMFASDNELTINRINDVLTYQPPPIVYDVTLGDGTIGDNSGNIVFYLNGVETPVLHLTRGLNYEFNINGVDMSSNKFVFTKELKSDGVDICLNPIESSDASNDITSCLTYELDNSVKSFNDFYTEYESATTRKIKWSIPFNEVNVPSNSFYGSDISDNLGGNIVINKNPIYGAMKFIDGDLIQFHLDYSQKAIVDASGVAVDSSGNKLGSNPIEEQDYIVRLHVHDLFHHPKLKIQTPHPTILTIVNNLGPKDLSDVNIKGYVPGADEDNATSRLGYASGTSFTISVKFMVMSNTMAPPANSGYDMIFGKYSAATSDYFIGFNGWPTFHWNFPGESNSSGREALADHGIQPIAVDDSVILTMTHDYTSRTSTFYINGVSITTLTLSKSNYYNDFYIKNGEYDSYSSSSLESAFITHNILNISDIESIHDLVQTAISNGHDENTPLELPTQNLNTQISYPIYNLNTQIKQGFKFLSTETDRNWRNWVTLDSSGIYLNNEASGNILGLQFATDSDEFGIGICSDVCDNILGPAITLYEGFNDYPINDSYWSYTNTNSNNYFDASTDSQEITNVTSSDGGDDFTIILNGISDDNYDYTEYNPTDYNGSSFYSHTTDSSMSVIFLYGNSSGTKNGIRIGRYKNSPYLFIHVNGKGFYFENYDALKVDDTPSTYIFSYSANPRSSPQDPVNGFAAEEIAIWKIDINGNLYTYYKDGTIGRILPGGLGLVNDTDSKLCIGSNMDGTMEYKGTLGSVYYFNKVISSIDDLSISKKGWPWEFNVSPTNYIPLNTFSPFIWAFDASLNGNNYKYKIADTGGVIEDYPVDKLHNQKYNWKIEIKSDGKLCLKTSTDSALNVISSYSNIILDPDTRYYLWIGSKDPSFNFTNLKYLPETRVYDDEVTLGSVVQTYSQGSTISYNPYNVVEQTEVTYNLSIADITYLVTQGSNRIYIDGNRYTESSPLELVSGNTYRFNLVNSTNLDTRLVFSELSNGTDELSAGITYNGTPGIYETSQGSRDRVPYVDINTNDLIVSTLYYYDANEVNNDISGTIVVITPITVTVIGNIFNLSPNNTLLAGKIYRFIQTDSTNTNHPFRISLTVDDSDYTTGVSYVGIPGQSGSYTQLIVPSDYNSEDLSYKCQYHSGMGAAFT